MWQCGQHHQEQGNKVTPSSMSPQPPAHATAASHASASRHRYVATPSCHHSAYGGKP